MILIIFLAVWYREYSTSLVVDLYQCLTQADLSQWLDKNDLLIYPFVLPYTNRTRKRVLKCTVKLQKYECFKVLNGISCIRQAKITLVKKDVNAFCIVTADEYKGMVLKT